MLTNGEGRLYHVRGPARYNFPDYHQEFDRIKQDPASGSLQLVAQAGARYEDRIFFVVEE